MKKLFAIMFSILIVSNTLVFAGCDNKEETSSINEEYTEAVVTTSPYLVNNEKCNYVELAYKTHISYTDSEGIEYDVTYKVPKFSINSEDVNEINEEINDICEELVKESEICQEHKTTLITTSLDYASYQNDSIVTLLITAENCWGITDYYVYNIDGVTGEELDDDDILKALSLTETDLNSLFNTAINNMFAEFMQESEDDSAYKEQIEKTLDEDNIDDAQLFFGNDKSLWAIGKVYSVAGGDFYYRLIQLT